MEKDIRTKIFELENKYKFWLNVLCLIANIIIIILSFSIAFINKWWLCLFIPFMLNFHIVKDKEDKQ